jgi:hypothetical protein
MDEARRGDEWGEWHCWAVAQGAFMIYLAVSGHNNDNERMSTKSTIASISTRIIYI